MGELTLTDYIVIGLGIWVALLSFFTFKAIKHYQHLGRGENIQNLGKILERIISKQDLNSNHINELAKQIESQKEISRGHFTKFAMIRFNPFEETGGDQSFIIALLDSKNSGVVLSSLHSRSGTRIYAKEVVAAKATNHKFSKEEKEAVEKAVHRV